MSDLFELLLDLFIDGAGALADKASSKATGKSGAAFWLSILLTVLMVCAMLAYFAIGAYLNWRAGDVQEMWMDILFLALMAAALAFIGLRRLIRWLKKRKETMYDPRYQK